jgi:hypothetical protein
LIRHRVEFVVVGGFAAVAHGVTLLTVLAQSVEVALPGGPCRILAIDALVRAKQAMGRDKDRETILQLRAIQERTRGR